jgi:nitroimidazol reductase NimA-like FMN-containing flavoprotein (pyridoxamine 5'-phosphate oxidase superfamily)
MSTTHTLLYDIHPDDCADLLGCSPIGRIAVTVNGHPEIFPVSHVYDRESGCVMFPTNVGSKLRAALGASEVAFEVDGVSPDGDRGWSVLVVGKAEEVTDEETMARAASERSVIWRTGNRVHWIRIVPWKVTGRRICASDRGITVRID